MLKVCKLSRNDLCYKIPTIVTEWSYTTLVALMPPAISDVIKRAVVELWPALKETAL